MTPSQLRAQAAKWQKRALHVVGCERNKCWPTCQHNVAAETAATLESCADDKEKADQRIAELEAECKSLEVNLDTAVANWNLMMDECDTLRARRASFTSDEAVERAAKAICPIAWEEWPVDTGIQGFRLVMWEEEQETARRKARAALQAAATPNKG